MRITITPTASNTPTPSITASLTPTQTPTGTVCPGLTPTSTGDPTPTPTQTAETTPAPTQTQTQTPDTTPAPTPTPTNICNCKNYDVNVSQDDLDDATENVIFLNNTLYVKFTDCDNNEEIRTYDVAGTYIDDFCALTNTFIFLYYYQNDNIALSSFSSVDVKDDCC